MWVSHSVKSRAVACGECGADVAIGEPSWEESGRRLWGWWPMRRRRAGCQGMRMVADGGGGQAVGMVADGGGGQAVMPMWAWSRA